MTPGVASTINFSVSGTIVLGSDLPSINNDVKIDARTAPGYVSGKPPVVAINFNVHAGLLFSPGSRGSRLLGIAVDNASGTGVTVAASSVTLYQDYIGLNTAGAAFGNRGNGVYLAPGSTNNMIGLNPSGASGAVGNVISGNLGSGLALVGSSGNTVVSNRIGTDPTGTAAIPNGGNGISISGSSNNNEVGGTEFVDSRTGKTNNPTGTKGQVPPVFVVPPLGNLVSGNGQNGVLIDTSSEGNILNGNFVGTSSNGDSGIGNAGDGVLINGASDNSLIGCQFSNNPFVYYNVLSSNGRSGLQITNSNDVTVQANFFGIGADNSTTLANRYDGILVTGSSRNTQVGGVIPLGNVSAGNGANGIEVRDQVSGFVTFNTFGGLLAFQGAAPNGNDGLLITSTGGNNLVRTNVFSGNNNNGIELSGDASGVTVDPNIAGLTTKGSGVLPNGGNGLLIDGTAHGNTIGGTLNSVIPQNTFSGNVGYGLAIAEKAHDNELVNTFIGTNVFGAAALPNQRGGVLISGTADNNSIGTSSSNPSDLISGNGGNGITLTSGTTSNEIINNFIGLDKFGLHLPNAGFPFVNTGIANTFSGNSIYP